LKALQSRELTINNIRKALGAVTQATAAGAEKNLASPPDIQAMLNQAIAGMDSALLKAVEANRKALQQFVDQGANLQEKQLQGALANLEKVVDAVTRAKSWRQQPGAPAFVGAVPPAQGFSG